MKSITIVVEGGVIQEILDIPANIQVVVRDYDIDGSEELETDGAGDQYVQTVWEANAFD